MWTIRKARIPQTPGRGLGGLSALKKTISISNPFPQKSEPLLYGEPMLAHGWPLVLLGAPVHPTRPCGHILLLSNRSNI